MVCTWGEIVVELIFGAFYDLWIAKYVATASRRGQDLMYFLGGVTCDAGNESVHCAVTVAGFDKIYAREEYARDTPAERQWIVGQFRRGDESPAIAWICGFQRVVGFVVKTIVVRKLILAITDACLARPIVNNCQAPRVANTRQRSMVGWLEATRLLLNRWVDTNNRRDKLALFHRFVKVGTAVNFTYRIGLTDSWGFVVAVTSAKHTTVAEAAISMPAGAAVDAAAVTAGLAALSAAATGGA